MQPLDWPKPGGLPWRHQPRVVGIAPINSSRKETPGMNDTPYIWKPLRSTETLPVYCSPISSQHKASGGPGKVLQDPHFTDQKTKTARDQEPALNSIFQLSHPRSFHSIPLLLQTGMDQKSKNTKISTAETQKNGTFISQFENEIHLSQLIKNLNKTISGSKKSRISYSSPHKDITKSHLQNQL